MPKVWKYLCNEIKSELDFMLCAALSWNAELRGQGIRCCTNRLYFFDLSGKLQWVIAPHNGHICCWEGKSWILVEQYISLHLDGNLSNSSFICLTLYKKRYISISGVCACVLGMRLTTLYINLYVLHAFLPSSPPVAEQAFRDAWRICCPPVTLRT